MLRVEEMPPSGSTMKSHTVTLYTCEVCGEESEDRAYIEQCEAKAVATPPAVGTIGYIYELLFVEGYGCGNLNDVEAEWIVQVRITDVIVKGHDVFCAIEVVPWTPKDADDRHRDMISVSTIKRSPLPMREVYLDRGAAEKNFDW